MLKQMLIAITFASSTQAFAAEQWVDVRVPEQFQQEHIQGAVNIPLKDIQAGQVHSLSRDDTLYLYCNSGRQATLAQEKLQQLGYQHVINKGGMNQLNMPTIKSQ
ncbi:thiosulfate sulfurtransferase PspE [Yokenella regensburgei]|uniref:thiosulfate sulfurtransferase PspE n=1 Tax=Yokenella regensburgei TaxID=158877 RepID=UPI003F1836A2